VLERERANAQHARAERSLSALALGAALINMHSRRNIYRRRLLGARRDAPAT